jgi:hypothetical protein
VSEQDKESVKAPEAKAPEAKDASAKPASPIGTVIGVVVSVGLIALFIGTRVHRAQELRGGSEPEPGPRPGTHPPLVVLSDEERGALTSAGPASAEVAQKMGALNALVSTFGPAHSRQVYCKRGGLDSYTAALERAKGESEPSAVATRSKIETALRDFCVGFDAG